MLLDKPCRVREFAALAGVTVRALHHYDRLGLLRPRRASSGYRLYGNAELERLEQIVALKFIGVPLRQIKAMLDRNSAGLADALRMQRTVLEEKQKLLEMSSTPERLRMLVAHLTDTLRKLEQQRVYKETAAKVRGNGDLGRPHKEN